VLLILTALALTTPSAEAAGFQAKTMRAPLSAVEVERPLVIGRGWLELGLGADYKLASGYWDDEGNSRDFEAGPGFEGAQWLYTTQRADLRYGISRRGEIYASLPFHYVRLTNDELGTDTSTFGLGDPRFGWRLEWFHRDAPTTSIISELEMKVPAGSESAATFIGGPNTVSTFVMSTGTPDLSLTARGKQQLGPIAVEAGLGYVHRFSAVTQYVIEVDQYQFLGRFRPGSEVRANLGALVQLGPVAVGADGLFRLRGAAASGTTSTGVIPDAHLDPIAGTEGWSFDLQPRLVANVTRGFDVDLGVGIPIRGEGLGLFPLEEITPTRGITYSGSIELRY
jgi:hypothetical protein